MHSSIVLTFLPFTLSKLNHCSMTLHDYTLKRKIKMTGDENDFYEECLRTEYID